MMATEKALGISFEMAEIGEIGEIVEIGTFISPFRWCKKPPKFLHIGQSSVLISDVPYCFISFWLPYVVHK